MLRNQHMLSLHSHNNYSFDASTRSKPGKTHRPLTNVIDLIEEFAPTDSTINPIQSFKNTVQSRIPQATQCKLFDDVTLHELQRTFNHLNILSRASKKQMNLIEQNAYRTIKVILNQ